MLFQIEFREDHKSFNAEFRNFQAVTVREDIEYYVGSHEVTPSDEKQVLSTGGKLLNSDIVVNPIPKEYGLVTYDQNRSITIS